MGKRLILEKKKQEKKQERTWIKSDSMTQIAICLHYVNDIKPLEYFFFFFLIASYHTRVEYLPHSSAS